MFEEEQDAVAYEELQQCIRDGDDVLVQAVAGFIVNMEVLDDRAL